MYTRLHITKIDEIIIIVTTTTTIFCLVYCILPVNIIL